MDPIGVCDFCTLPVTGVTGMRYSSGRIEHHACGDAIRRQEVRTARSYAVFLRFVPILRRLRCLRSFADQLAAEIPDGLEPRHFVALADRIVARAECEPGIPSQDLSDLRAIRSELQTLWAYKS